MSTQTNELGRIGDADRASRATHGAPTGLHHSATIPCAGEIVSFLAEGYGDFVIQQPGRKRVVPEEIWIPGLGCWVRADGFSACGDNGRGYRYFGRIDRWRIKRAVKTFRRLEAWSAQAIEARRAATLGAVHESAISEGNAPEGNVP